MKIPLRVVRRVIRQHQMHRVRAILHQPGQVKIGPDIAVDQRKGLIAQQRQGALDAAGGFQRRAFVGVNDGNAVAGTVTQRGRQRLAQPAGVDYQGLDAGVTQRLDVVFDQRLAPRLQQRLGGMVGERSHTLAVAGGQDHGLHASSSS